MALVGGIAQRLTVGRDDDVRDKVVVTLEDLFGETVLVVISGELPDDDALVCSRKGVGKMVS